MKPVREFCRWFVVQGKAPEPLQPARTTMTSTPHRKHLITLAAAAMVLAGQASLAQTAPATTSAAVSFNVPAQPLDQALAQFARQAGLQLAASPDLIRGLQGRAVRGTLGVQAALDELLRGSGLGGRVADGLLTIERASPSASAETTLPVVRVKADAVRETATGPVLGYVANRSATATKTDTPLIEIPQSISVVTADRIAAIGAHTLADVVAYTPGVNMGDGYDTRNDWLVFRGFDAWDQGYFVDGLQLRNNNSFLTWRLEPYGAERIEIIRGPSSVLYGQNIPGGTINAVSKRPTATPQGELRLQLGTHDRREIAADISGPLDDEGKVLYRVTGLALDSNTQIDHVPDSRTFIAPALTWRPSTDTSLTLLSHFQRIRTSNSRGSLPAAGTLLSNPNGRIPTSTFVGEPDFNHFDQDQWTVGYQFEHTLSDTLTFRQNARYGKADVDYQEVFANSTFTVVNPGVPDDPANFRRVDRGVFGVKEKGSLFALDNQLQAVAHIGGWKHIVLAGLDHQRSRYTQYQFYGDGVASIDVYAPVYGLGVVVPDPYLDANIALNQTGLYLQDQVKLGDRWAFTLGGRYDRFRYVTDDHLASTRSMQSKGAFTRRAGAVYLVPSGWAPYVSYSESFAPIVSAVDSESGEPFKPETGRQYEAGIRFQPPGSKDSYSVAAFDLRRRNYLTFDENFQPRQVGEVVVQGVEFEALIEPIRNLNLTAAYSWTPKADVTASSDPLQIGKQNTAVPRHSLSVWADYRFAGGIKAGIGARYVGSTYGYNEQAPTKVPGYTLFDAMVGYELGPWNFTLNARNLTDDIYVARSCQDRPCNYGERRQIVGTAAYRW